MSFAGVGEGQHCTDPCSQLSALDEAGDLRQTLAGDIDQKERGFDSMGFGKMLIRRGHRRNELAAWTEDLKRPLLCFATDQIDHSIRISNLILKAPRVVIDDDVGAEVFQKGCVIRCCGRDGAHTRATGQLNRVRANISCRTVNDHRLA